MRSGVDDEEICDLICARMSSFEAGGRAEMVCSVGNVEYSLGVKDDVFEVLMTDSAGELCEVTMLRRVLFTTCEMFVVVLCAE